MALDAIIQAVTRHAMEEERARLEARLQQAQRMEQIGFFTSGIAHNFNNILGGILGHSEVIEEHVGSDAKLVRNLGPAEIVSQFMAARDAYGEWPSPKGETPRLLSTIVLMGMGEPLYNYENVARAMTIVMDHEGIGLSRRRITLSTSGVVPMMDRCGAELGVNLAVSLHAVRDDLRDELVPLNRKYPLAELVAACRRYPGASNARRITFEYVMLKDVNDTPADARGLVRLIAGIPAKVNLIPFNPWPGSAFETSTPEAIRRFAEIVMDAGYASPVRTPRGRDILAACGQLRTLSHRTRSAA